MGMKYEIRFMRNGTCPYGGSRRTEYLIVALWYLFILMIKYKIVTMNIRRGYDDCDKCRVDYCEKSKKSGVVQMSKAVPPVVPKNEDPCEGCKVGTAEQRCFDCSLPKNVLRETISDTRIVDAILEYFEKIEEEAAVLEYFEMNDSDGFGFNLAKEGVQNIIKAGRDRNG
jgi:hypothetical protein